MAKIFMLLLKLTVPKDFSSSGDVITKLFEGKVKFRISENIQNLLLDQSLPINYFLKIGLLLMLCFASFMMNFHNHREALNYNTEIAAEKYNTNQNLQKALETNQNLINQDPINKVELNFFLKKND